MTSKQALTEKLNKMGLNVLYERIIEDLISNHYALVDGFFDEDTCRGLNKLLRQKMKQGILEKAGIGNKSNHLKNDAIRSDKIAWIDNHSIDVFEQAFIQQMNSFSLYLNNTCYTGIQDSEFHYACFEKGAFYKKHIDRFNNDNKRKFSVVTYLNKHRKASHGGALILYTEKGEINILPEWGRTIIFKSDLLEHEVLVSTKDRLSITGWLK
ncbi:MAG: oxidoreductase [Saprospiraceae bacterium]|nr:MAG: oxidoreductase [Saprospiraceae bacterium]